MFSLQQNQREQNRFWPQEAWWGEERCHKQHIHMLVNPKMIKLKEKRKKKRKTDVKYSD
jgi:hypothetical protein